ncbi:MAG: 4Fe-4S binding protein [Anaerolineaceae bacterium]|nr:4Fe-4S binding protein [Anaerolineaceae bacterium]MBN2677567.1 4Fe-4S binding protein [Anaerolineaceae bacterium]
MKMIIDQSLCKGCGVCVSICPVDAIVMHAGKAFINRSKCTSCLLCIEACPTGALQQVQVDDRMVTRDPASSHVVQSQTIVEASQKVSDLDVTLPARPDQSIVPRMIEMLASYFLNHTTLTDPIQGGSGISTRSGHPYRRRRHRRGRMVNLIPFERR